MYTRSAVFRRNGPSRVSPAAVHLGGTGLHRSGSPMLAERLQLHAFKRSREGQPSVSCDRLAGQFTAGVSPSWAATGSMLNSIRNWSSSLGTYCFIRATTEACAWSGFDQSAV